MTKKKVKPPASENAKDGTRVGCGRWVIRQNDTMNYATRAGVFSSKVEDRAEFMTKEEAEQHANDYQFKSTMITVEAV